MAENPQSTPLIAPTTASRTVLAGYAHTGSSQAVRAILLLGSTIILARLLSPEDFGVVAMAAPVLALLLLFQDLGLSAATVQAKSITDEQSNTIFWVTFMVSASLASLLVVASPLVGSFYDDARVGYVTAAYGGILLLTSTALQPTALLSRRLEFRVIGRIVIVSASANFAATVICAFLLANYWAIVLGNLTGAAVQLGLTWKMQPWRPQRRFALRGAGSILRFGGSVAAFDLLNFLSRNADNILIGRFWGAGPLGFYERSYSLMMAPLQLVSGPIARVMLPVLSRLQEEPQRYNQAYLSSLGGLLLATMPVAALAIATSEQLVSLLLGSRWSAAAPIFFWLAIGCLYQPLGSSLGLLFTSTGRGRALFQWGLFSSATTVLSFVAGLQWGPVGVAKAYIIAGLLRLPVLVIWATRTTPVRAIDVYAIFLPLVAAALATAAVLRALMIFMHPTGVVILGLPLAYGLAAAIVWTTPRGRRLLQTTYDTARSLVRARIRSAV